MPVPLARVLSGSGIYPLFTDAASCLSYEMLSVTYLNMAAIFSASLSQPAQSSAAFLTQLSDWLKLMYWEGRRYGLKSETSAEKLSSRAIA